MIEDIAVFLLDILNYFKFSILVFSVSKVAAPLIASPLIKLAGVPVTPAFFPSAKSSLTFFVYFPLDKHSSKSEAFRLRLIESFRTCLKNALHLLGIEVMEEM